MRRSRSAALAILALGLLSTAAQASSFSSPYGVSDQRGRKEPSEHTDAQSISESSTVSPLLAEQAEQPGCSLDEARRAERNDHCGGSLYPADCCRIEAADVGCQLDSDPYWMFVKICTEASREVAARRERVDIARVGAPTLPEMPGKVSKAPAPARGKKH